MTSRLGNMFRRRTAIETGRQNPVLLSTVDMSSKIYDGIPLKNFIGEDKRDALARELFLEINLICNAYDPVAACRQKLATMMIKFASFQVLVIPPAPEEDVSGLRGQPGITGELKQHLLQIVQKNHDLQAHVYEASGSRSPRNVVQTRSSSACDPSLASKRRSISSCIDVSG